MSGAEATERFTAALHALERERDVATIANLFATDSDLGAVVSPRGFRGSDGAREFWESYRGWFGEIESTFRNGKAPECPNPTPGANLLLNTPRRSAAPAAPLARP